MLAVTSVAQPASWTIVVTTDHTTLNIPACDEAAAVRAAWFQAACHAGHDYGVTIRIDGPGATFPAITIPATWPDPEPQPWDLNPEPIELEEDELVF